MIEKSIVKYHCDCCGEEIMAQERDGKLVIIQHRHGEKHYCTIPLTKFENSAIKKDS